MKRTAMLCGLVLLLAGCGGESDRGAQGDGPGGTLLIDGSSTVFPLTEAVAEEFMRAHRGARVTVGISGTGGGFSKFLRGETDVNDASRPIREAELNLARQNNIGFIELPVAYDGLAVVVHPQNDWAACLTVEELRRIWRPGSEVNNWSQVRPGFPDRPLVLYGAGTDSGTYDYFTEAIVGQEGASRAEFTASEDDNVLVQGIQGDVNALGFLPYAYYEENQGRLKLVAIDDENPANGEGCVEPNAETVRGGTYQPLSRPIFIYVRSDRADDPLVRAFVEFYLQEADGLAQDVGYVPLPGSVYELALERFHSGVTGSVFESGSQIGVSLDDLLRQEGGAAAGVPADTAAGTAAPR